MKKIIIFCTVTMTQFFPIFSFAQSKIEITHFVTCETKDVNRDNLAKSITSNILLWAQQGRYDTVAEMIRENQKNPRDPGSVGCERIGKKLKELPKSDVQMIKNLGDSTKSYYLYREKNKASYWIIIQNRP